MELPNGLSKINITSFEKKILDSLPSESFNAKKTIDIYHKLSEAGSKEGFSTIKQSVRDLRLKGYPILWNSKGIYMTWDSEKIEKHMKLIERYKFGYMRGMDKINEALKSAIV